MEDKTCTEYIKLILKRGGRWRNKQIEEAILRDYGVQFQNNTIAKYLSFLIKGGKVLSAPVAEKGKVCFEYWWITPNRKTKKPVPLTIAQLLEECRSAAATYPIDHPLLIPIEEQYTKLEKIIDKEKAVI